MVHELTNLLDMCLINEFEVRHTLFFFFPLPVNEQETLHCNKIQETLFNIGLHTETLAQ